MDKENEKKELSFFKEKSNYLFLGALLIIIAVRLYFFFMTIHQPLWWDESEYMSGAKGFAGIVDYSLSIIRLPGFSMLASLFFISGLDSDFILKLFLTLIPSIIALILTYFVSKEMYGNKKMAVISMIIMAFIWEHIFYSNRFHTENLALIFEYLALIVLFKSYVKKEKSWFIKPKYSLFFVALLSVIALIFRPGNIVFIPAIVLFIPIVNFKFLKENKVKTYITLAALFAVGLFVLFNLDKIPLVSTYYNTVNPISFNVLTSFKGFYQPSLVIPAMLFYFFLFGLVVSLFGFWLKLPIIKELKRNDESMELKSDIMSILLIVCSLAVFIFLMRVNTFEYRWLFPMILGVLNLTSSALIKISNYLKKLGDFVPAMFVLAVLILSTYGQFDFSKNLVQNKASTYEQVRDAGLWIKEHSAPEDVVVSASVPQNTYYSERKTYNFALGNPSGEKNETYFDDNLAKIRPRYIVVSAFEPSFTPEWAYSWAQKNQNISAPVQVYFADAQKQQPILVIYEVKYS